MSESILQLDIGSPLDIYGPGDKYLNQIKEIFPKLKIIARGELIKLIGEEKEIRNFEKRFDLLLIHFDRFGKITEDVVRQIMLEDNGITKSAGEQGEDIRLIAIRLLAPERPEDMAAALKGVKRLLVVEQSHSRQFHRYLRAAYDLPANTRVFNRPGPLPFRPNEIIEQLQHGRAVQGQGG